jgi:hypothetical protein
LQTPEPFGLTKHAHGLWQPTDLVQALPHVASVLEVDFNCRAETALSDMTAANTAAHQIFPIIAGSFPLFF